VGFLAGFQRFLGGLTPQKPAWFFGYLPHCLTGEYNGCAAAAAGSDGEAGQLC